MDGHRSEDTSGFQIHSCADSWRTEGPARDGELTPLRRAAIALGHGSQVAVPLAAVWRDFTSGRLRAVDHFLRDGTCYLITTENGSGRPPRGARNLEILTRALLGEAQKVVAFDFRISDSSVAMVLSRWAACMGFSGRASISAILMMAARSAKLDDAATVESATLEAGEDALRVFRARVPDPGLLRVLTKAELAIVRLLFERRSNAEIALIRQTSVRTTANQLASAFRKLKVGGRTELLSRVISAA